MPVKEAPDEAVKASYRAREVVAAYRTLTMQDNARDNAKHLWALAAQLVADIHRGEDNYPRSPEG